MQRAVGSAQTFHGQDCLVLHFMSQCGTGVDVHVIGKHCAGAALAAVAAKLGAGQTQLVAQCVSKGFLRSNVYTARLAVHADGQEPLDSAGRPALSGSGIPE